jgi:hypothetical protein
MLKANQRDDKKKNLRLKLQCRGGEKLAWYLPRTMHAGLHTEHQQSIHTLFKSSITYVT